MRMTLRYAGLVLVALALAAASPAQARTELRAANIHNPNQTQTLALRKWGELLDAATGGEITVRVFDSGTIVSNQQDAYGQVKLGSVDVVLSVAVEGDVAALQIPFFPYAFRSYKQWRAFMDSEHMQALYDEFLDKTGIRILGIQYIGARHLTANKPIYKPADLNGMKIRAPELPLWMETVRGMGALPTPVAFQEVMSGLMTGVIDGQENPVPTIYQMKFHEAQSHLMLTTHIRGADYWMINERKFQSFAPEQQALLQRLAQEAIRWGDELVIEQEQELVAKLKAEGATVIGVNDGLDLDAFSQRVRDTAWPVLTPNVGKDIIDRVRSFQAE